MSQITISSAFALVPEICLLILLVAILAYDRLLKPSERRRVGLLAAWGFFITLAVDLTVFYLFREPGSSQIALWGGMFRHDAITFIFRIMFLIAGGVVSLIAMDIKALQSGEFYALLVTSTIGFNLMAAAGDLIALYVALETASISLYVLGGYATKDKLSAEAGMKYFVYGAFASAVMLYGMSLLYGLTGQTNMQAIAAGIANSGYNGVTLLAAVLVLVGLGFKISIVPFHFWAPDVYEGAPTAVTAYLSTASKAAGFAVIMRVFLLGTLGIPRLTTPWWSMLVAMCIVTMTLGNFLAIYQKNIKRMLAYSSIAQAGYVMIGFVTMTPDGAGAAMFYLLMYILTNTAAFAVIILAANATGSEQLEDFNGLSRRSPFLALAMLLALLSLGGIPPTAGFFAKFFLFKAAIEGGLWGLALAAILNAFVALYYYLSVAKYMYLYRSDEEDVPIPVPRAYQVALALTIFGVLYLGVFAGPTFELTRNAGIFFFGG